jgi:hypothetical protein
MLVYARGGSGVPHVAYLLTYCPMSRNKVFEPTSGEVGALLVFPVMWHGEAM